MSKGGRSKCIEAKNQVCLTASLHHWLINSLQLIFPICLGYLTHCIFNAQAVLEYNLIVHFMFIGMFIGTHPVTIEHSGSHRSSKLYSVPRSTEDVWKRLEPAFEWQKGILATKPLELHMPALAI